VAARAAAERAEGESGGAGGELARAEGEAVPRASGDLTGPGGADEPAPPPAALLALAGPAVAGPAGIGPAAVGPAVEPDADDVPAAAARVPVPPPGRGMSRTLPVLGNS
jgi:hypothetical protein